MELPVAGCEGVLLCWFLGSFLRWRLGLERGHSCVCVNTVLRIIRELGVKWH